jgi:excisionase family DNA binding protein
MQAQSAVSQIIKNQSTDPLFTPKETSEYLGITKDTLSVWRCVGRYNIPYLKVGRLVKYRKSDLDAWLAGRTHSTEA